MTAWSKLRVSTKSSNIRKVNAGMVKAARARQQESERLHGQSCMCLTVLQ